MMKRKAAINLRRPSSDSNRSRHRLAAFTLVEMVVASIIVAFVLGAVSLSLAQVGKARNSTRIRLQAFLRAQNALDAIRKDIASTVRDSDLFNCRVVLTNDTSFNGGTDYERDDLLLFSDRLRAIHALNYSGEGLEYETQYRVIDDDLGPIMQQRRDPVPDRYDRGGGVVTPVGEGVVGLQIEVFDGEWWWDEWDSDEYGLPHAVRVTLTTSGADPGSDAYDDQVAFATVRTVIAIDRTPVPPPIEEELTVDTDGDGIPDATAEEAEAGGRDGAEGDNPAGGEGGGETVVVPGGAGGGGRGGSGGGIGNGGGGGGGFQGGGALGGSAGGGGKPVRLPGGAHGGGGGGAGSGIGKKK